MYDLIFDFINNTLINSSSADVNLSYIMTDVTIVLMYVCLVMLLIWCVNVAKGIFNL